MKLSICTEASENWVLDLKMQLCNVTQTPCPLPLFGEGLGSLIPHANFCCVVRHENTRRWMVGCYNGLWVSCFWDVLAYITPLRYPYIQSLPTLWYLCTVATLVGFVVSYLSSYKFHCKCVSVCVCVCVWCVCVCVWCVCVCDVCVTLHPTKLQRTQSCSTPLSNPTVPNVPAIMTGDGQTLIPQITDRGSNSVTIDMH